MKSKPVSTNSKKIKKKKEHTHTKLTGWSTGNNKAFYLIMCLIVILIVLIIVHKPKVACLSCQTINALFM